MNWLQVDPTITKLDLAKAIRGIGPGGKMNHAYACGYATLAFERNYGQTTEEALQQAGIEVPRN